MDAAARGSHRLSLVDLPNEILHRIFENFGQYAGSHRYNEGWRYPEHSQPSDLPALQNSRLVCHRLNTIVTPLLCPVLRVSMDEDSLHRLQQLTRNPLIAGGVCGLDVNLRYQPGLFAQNLCQYHTHVQGNLDKARGTCDYHTEFGDYDTEDESEDALQHRAYMKADDRLRHIGGSWTEYVERQEDAHQDQQVTEDDFQAAQEASANRHDQLDQEHGSSDHDDVEQDQAEFGPPAEIDIEAYQNLLQENFESYVKRHSEQNHMLTSGSFTRTLTSVLLRSKLRPFLWFGDDEDLRCRYHTEPFDLVDDNRYLSLVMKSKKRLAGH